MSEMSGNVSVGDRVSIEETITVTLPLDVAKKYVEEHRMKVVSHTTGAVYDAIKASLPKPKSPEQVVMDMLVSRYGAGMYAWPTGHIVEALRAEGWLRDTPEKPRAD